MNKTARQKHLLEIVKSREIETQEHLREALRRAGFDVTQATLSRDIKELGVIKTRWQGRLMYSLEAAAPERRNLWKEAARMMSEFVADIQRSANLVVLKTAPGNAQGVAAAVDRVGLPGVLGTVAGDDTILVITEDTSAGADALRTLRELWLGNHSESQRREHG